MIEVRGSTQLSFLFPANWQTAYCYYQEIEKIVLFLPHIRLLGANGGSVFRLAYETTELGAYHIRIICDVEAIFDRENRLLAFLPAEYPPVIPDEAGFRSATTRGYYQSQSYFFAEGQYTRIEYHLKLQADLPTPRALRPLPTAVLNKISHNITHWRIQQIARGFIENSIAAFQQEHNPMQ